VEGARHRRHDDVLTVDQRAVAVEDDEVHVGVYRADRACEPDSKYGRPRCGHHFSKQRRCFHYFSEARHSVAGSITCLPGHQRANHYPQPSPSYFAMTKIFELGTSASLNPKGSLEGKSNFKLTFRITRDGSVARIIRLRVLDERLREQIICRHFLTSYLRRILRQDPSITIRSRDRPWDFEIELDNGENFYLEITAISENKTHFKQQTRERKLARIIHRTAIPLSLLEKINNDFPNQRAEQIISVSRACGLGRNEEVQNPWFGPMEPLFVGDRPVSGQSLLEHLANAIASKAQKNNEGKENTILIIDNRSTSFELEDLRVALSDVEKLRSISVFKQVWFYTGYYSDPDGGNAEWSLCPVLLPRHIEERLIESEG